MDHVTTHLKRDEGAAEHRLSPLEAFVAWVASLIATLTGMKRRKVFPTNWKDHWAGLRQLEWCWDQTLAFSAAHVLAGKSLDEDAGFQLVMDVPADYGRPCPSTPREMNRRFILIQRLRLDPDKYILRHIRRIAKREGIVLATSSSGCPLVSPDCAKVVAGETPTAPRVLRPYGAWGSPACLVPPEQLPGTPLKRRTPRQG